MCRGNADFFSVALKRKAVEHGCGLRSTLLHRDADLDHSHRASGGIAQQIACGGDGIL
jgi:hypothetical protein